MILGITGSRHGATPAQLEWMRGWISQAVELHHGGCVGVDEAGHRIAKELGLRVVAHPPVDEKLMMPPDFVVWNWKPAKPYLDRNRDIVDEADRIIAVPDGPEKRSGGTWYTIRYAVTSGKPVMICYPDGAVEER